MAKPRVIIADEDANYMIALQFKFVTEFFNKIDLEIISDREYFHDFFSKPQNAEILIISDALYDSSIQRHNIPNIFVMMEQYDEGGTGELNVNRLFKYTSIKEIFNEIIGKSAGALYSEETQKRETQIILITSAQGGTGKTTIAMGLAASLSKSYKKVLYINASHLQNFQYLLDNDTTLASAEVYTKLLHPTEHIYEEIKHVIRKENFSYIPAFKAALLSMGMEYSIYEKIAISAKNSIDFDFVILDAESTFDEDKTKLMDIADKVIVVTDQTYHGVQATNGLISNVNGMNSEKYVFICNKFDKNNYNALISTDVPKKFTVNEYIETFLINGKMKCEDFMDNKQIRKVSFLVL